MVGNKIKWGIIQPLTGGMYIGARNAIGHAADFILSYPGLDSVKTDSNGNMTSVGNEYNLLKWCEAHNELPPYKIFSKQPFDGNFSTDIELLDTQWYSGDIDFSNTDIVLSVPVCSGLSSATIADDSSKMKKNCNMLWNEMYALEIIKPKAYIFENAPALYSSKAGEGVRNMIEDIAERNGYSVMYYKTDTQYHDNCQHRQRTFVIIMKDGVSPIGLEHISTNVVEYLSRIPEDASQQVTIDMNPENKVMWDFIKYHYGENYRETIKPLFIDNFIKDNLWDEFAEWLKIYDCKEQLKEKISKLFEHIRYKISLGKNFYCINPKLTCPDTKIQACNFQTIPTLIHYKEDRLYTVREYLHMMGMPHDFILYGDINDNYAKIGQNVPARTAQFIVSEVLKLLSDWENIEKKKAPVFIDNTK